MKDTPSKTITYSYIDGSEWLICEGEDFSDNTVLLYNFITGEDFSCRLDKFGLFFTPIK